MKKDYSATPFLVLVFLVVGCVFSFVSCQPKTVIVERRDGELIPITPEPSPSFIVIERGVARINNVPYTVYKMIDLEDRQVCTVLKHYDQFGVSCRPMTEEEISEWKEEDE